jgi:signal transduction histidine kinase
MSRMDQRPGGHPVAAVAVWVVAWALSLTALGIQLVAGVLPAGDEPGYFANPTYFALDVAMGLVNAPAAALLLSRSRNLVAWIAAAVALGFAASACALALALLAPEHDWIPAAGFLGHAFTWLWVPGAFLAVTVMPWFLRDDPPGRWGRRAAYAGVALTFLTTLRRVVYQQEDAPRNPLELNDTPVGDALAVLDWFSVSGLVVLGVVAVGHLVVRARTETEHVRRALRTLAWAMGVLVASFTVLAFWPGDAAGRELVEMLAIPVLFGSQILMPLAIVLLVLRTRLWGVDVAVSRATTWTLLTSAVVGLYVVVVWAVGRLLPVDDEVAGLLAAASLALAVQPLRVWLQKRVDRIVYGDDSDPVSLLARLGEQLRGSGHGDGTLPALVESLQTGLRLGGVEVIAHDEPKIEARSGMTDDEGRPDTHVELPLVADHREIGTLVLRATPGQRLDLRTIRVVQHLSDVVAVSLDLAQANQRLRAASQRLGEVRHEERRLLRRELHDGLGPSLAGVGLGLAAARCKLKRDIPGTLRLLTELEAELSRRTDDVRLLARSLLPAQLDDGDLEEALEVLSERFEGSGLRIDTTFRAPDTLDTRHQIAIYHVAAEAVLNAYRHAGAAKVEVTVAAGDQGVSLDVVDDGIGVDPEARPGVGLQSMRERADELGGTLTVQPGPTGRGTQVRMVLP